MTRPRTAMDNTAARRDTALLIPEATPTRSFGTEFITVVVRGATVIAIPNPRITTPGKNVVQYVPPTEGTANSANPTAAMIGPSISGRLAPYRATRLPDHLDNKNMRRMN